MIWFGIKTLIYKFCILEDGSDRKRRKRSRWGGTENDKTFIPGMPTILPPTLDTAQQEAYLGKLTINVFFNILTLSKFRHHMNSSNFKNELTLKK